MRLTILSLLCLVSCAAAGKNWALLFTGANDWGNYSTHANLCHAYQVLSKAGIPDERIVVVMYDDVANHPLNPFPGQLFNNYNHTDVYKGTPLDYTGKEVTVELVLAVLKGDKAKVKDLTGRDGKVIDSGPDDNVFVAVSDHGGPGVLLMPDRLMTAVELNAALKYKYDNKQFAQLVFYLEACESGSIFKDLSKDLNIYAISASDAKNDAYMNYCYDPEIQGICIGGQFSTAWIENTELVDLSSFTFQKQSEAIIAAVNKSHPQLFGDQSILNQPLQDFFGGGQRRSQRVSTPAANVRSRSVPFSTMHLSLLQHQVEARPTDVSLRLKLARLQAMMADVDRFFRLAATHVYPAASSARVASITESKAEPIRNWDCYGTAVGAVSTSCPGLLQNDKVQGYFMSKLSALVNMCNRETGPVVRDAVLAASRQIQLCQQM